jgi:hypothetical protein
MRHILVTIVLRESAMCEDFHEVVCLVSLSSETQFIRISDVKIRGGSDSSYIKKMSQVRF